MADQPPFIPPRSSRLAGRDPSALVRDEVPIDLRNRVASLVVRLYESYRDLFSDLFSLVWGSLGRPPEALEYWPYDQRDALASLLTESDDVSEFLDTTEVVLKALKTKNWGQGYGLWKDGVEQAFLISRFGYRVVDDEIVEAGSDIENKAIDEARDQLLSDPRFTDAEEKFVSALRKITSNRDTDYPEAVHSSVSALEEVARELLGDDKILLDRALEKLRQRHDLDPNVTEMLKKLYHARGDLEGAAHGAGAGSEYIAKYVIHTAAAGMVYLVGECA